MWGKLLQCRPRMLTRDLFAVVNFLVFKSSLPLLFCFGLRSCPVDLMGYPSAHVQGEGGTWLTSDFAAIGGRLSISCHGRATQPIRWVCSSRVVVVIISRLSVPRLAAASAVMVASRWCGRRSRYSCRICATNHPNIYNVYFVVITCSYTWVFANCIRSQKPAV